MIKIYASYSLFIGRNRYIYADQYGVPYYYCITNSKQIISERVGEYVNYPVRNDWEPLLKASNCYYQQLNKSDNVYAYKFSSEEIVIIKWH